MTNCNPCNKQKECDPCGCITKQLIDECTGKKINYVTLASAVLMECNDDKTLSDALKEIWDKFQEIDGVITDIEDWEEFIRKIALALSNNNFALLNENSKLTNFINSIVNNKFTELQGVFTNFFNYWTQRLNELLSQFNNAHIRTIIEQLLADEHLVKGIRINGNEILYPDSEGIVDLGTVVTDQEKLDSIESGAEVNVIEGVKFVYSNSDLAISNKKAQFTPPMTGMLAVTGEKNKDKGITDYVIKCGVFDINQDGVVDISDVNIVMNIMLGKEHNQEYIERAQAIRNQGAVDIADVNAVINVMLGKVPAGYYFEQISTNSTWTPLYGLTYYNISTGRPFVLYQKNGDYMYWDESCATPDYADIENLVSDPNIDMETMDYSYYVGGELQVIEDMSMYFSGILVFDSVGNLEQVHEDNYNLPSKLIMQDGKIGTCQAEFSQSVNDGLVLSVDNVSNPQRFSRIHENDEFSNIIYVSGSNSRIESYQHNCAEVIAACKQ